MISIPYNPVFFSYAVVTPTTATLYVDSIELQDDVYTHLGKIVSVRPYEAILEDMEVLGQSVLPESEAAKVDPEIAKKQRKFLVSTRTSWALSQSLGGEEKVEEVRSPIGDAKAVKNDTELSGMRACHIRDGAALIEYFAWLEEQLTEKDAVIDEVQGADRLESIRSYGHLSLRRSR